MAITDYITILTCNWSLSSFIFTFGKDSKDGTAVTLIHYTYTCVLTIIDDVWRVSMTTQAAVIVTYVHSHPAPSFRQMSFLGRPQWMHISCWSLGTEKPEADLIHHLIPPRCCCSLSDHWLTLDGEQIPIVPETALWFHQHRCLTQVLHWCGTACRPKSCEGCFQRSSGPIYVCITHRES